MKGKKTGGRQRGTPNKSTLPLKELADKMGIDPFEILLRFAAEDWKGLGYPERTEAKYVAENSVNYEYVIDPTMRIKAASEACQYIYAKRKAIETTIDPDLIETIKSLDGKSEKELRDIVLALPESEPIKTDN